MPVNSQAKAYTTMIDKWDRCRAVVSGQDAVHLAAQKYLPKLAGQTPVEYSAYVLRASFYNATWRTIAGLSGMMFRKPPKVEVPSAVKEMLLNIDGAGQPLSLFALDTAENALTVGRVGILVDYPEAPEGITQADAILLNLRPSMKLYRAENIINWTMDVVNNISVPVMIVLKECALAAIDEFSSKEEDRWRVLDLLPITNALDKSEQMVYRQRLFKKKGNQNISTQAVEFEQVGSDIYPKIANKFWEEIPFVMVGVDDTSFEVDDPPLIDLVDTNLSHYRVTADYEHGCHFTGAPTLLLTGFSEKKDAAGNSLAVYVGGETAIVTDNDAANGKYIEFTGQGMGALEKNLDKKEKHMAVLGARMLEEQKRGVESAETVGIHRVGEQSMLSSVSISISLGITKALKWFTEWAGADSSDVLFEINRDFYPPGMTPQMLTALIGGWQAGTPGLSDQGIFTILKDAELVDEDVTLDEEQARIQERQLQLMNSVGNADPMPTDNASQSSASPQPIIIQLQKGNGKRTVTGPGGQKYTIEES